MTPLISVPLDQVSGSSTRAGSNHSSLEPNGFTTVINSNYLGTTSSFALQI
jgi:hypothetical protein